MPVFYTMIFTIVGLVIFKSWPRISNSLTFGEEKAVLKKDLINLKIYSVSTKKYKIISRSSFLFFATVKYNVPVLILMTLQDRQNA